MEYRLERDDKGPVVFNGLQLASVTTQSRGKMRWTELTLFKVYPTESLVNWVVESIGRSTSEGERDFHTVTLCTTVEDVAAALSKNDRLSGPGLDLMEAGADKDPELDAYLDKVFATEEVL